MSELFQEHRTPNPRAPRPRRLRTCDRRRAIVKSTAAGSRTSSHRAWAAQTLQLPSRRSVRRRTGSGRFESPMRATWGWVSASTIGPWGPSAFTVPRRIGQHEFLVFSSGLQRPEDYSGRGSSCAPGYLGETKKCIFLALCSFPSTSLGDARDAVAVSSQPMG